MQKNRTGIKALTHIGNCLKFDMSKGFPLITLREINYNSIKVELEFFIKGLSNKQWLKDRKCNIWNEWCNPKKVDDKLNENEKIKFQYQENDLGDIYGVQWRNFNNEEYDQLKLVIENLKKNKYNRRLIVTAWNPLKLNSMALPPCHLLFQFSIFNNKLNLTWYQRSCDVILGLPFNIASYATLLHLVAKEIKLDEGELIGMLNDTHIYENHLDGAKKLIDKVPYKSPEIKTENFEETLKWEYKDTKLINYKSHERIKFKIAI